MNTLDNLKAIKKHDASGMLGLIESFPAQVKEAKSIGESFRIPKGFRTDYKNIVFVGMGGSAIGAGCTSTASQADA